jgi:hypothetical protein
MGRTDENLVLFLKKKDLCVFEKMKVSTNCFEEELVLILGKSFSFSLLFASISPTTVLKIICLFDVLLLLSYSVVCTILIVDVSVGIFRVLAVHTCPLVGGTCKTADCGRVSLIFITKLGNCFHYRRVQYLLKIMSFYLITIWIFSIFT